MQLSVSHFHLCFLPPLQAVEQEFSEEEVTDFQHRDKNKEANVMEWVAKAISEPMQVTDQSEASNKTITLRFAGCCSDRLVSQGWG